MLGTYTYSANNQRVKKVVGSTTTHYVYGLGGKLWQRAGGRLGIVTGRKTDALSRRAADLEVDLMRQGVADKLPEAPRLKPIDIVIAEGKELCWYTFGCCFMTQDTKLLCP